MAVSSVGEFPNSTTDTFAFLLKTACPLRTSPSCALFLRIAARPVRPFFFGHTKWFD